MKPHQERSLWWEGGLYFSCLGCGRCCRGEPGAIWVTEKEQEAISERLGLTAETFRQSYLWSRYGKPSIRERANFDCVFLDGNSQRCRIYDVRPAQCGLFPFWPSLLNNKLEWDRYSFSCPGMNQGKYHDQSSIKQLLLASPWPRL